MANPARLGPGAVTVPPQQVWEGEVLDSAEAGTDLIRCRRPSDPQAATDPMPFTPLTDLAVGTFYPKRGDRAIFVYPVNGPPWILSFRPAPGATPDIPA